MAKAKSDDFEGYRKGDITYCVDPATDEFFPVRITQIGLKFVDVESIRPELTAAISLEFDTEEKNRRFFRPKLPAASRFGGCDERTLNAERVSGQELRLLPFHYATLTGRKIKERNRDSPEHWPLPTGIIFERWFKDSETQ